MQNHRDKLFIESIAVRNGFAELLNLHQERMDRTWNNFFRLGNPFLISELMQEAPAEGFYKLRIVYGEDYLEKQFIPYTPRKITSLKTVYAPRIDYAYKYADRSKLTGLYNLRGTADDVIIVKNGLITDSYYANLVFLKNGTWLTPSQPLLKGIRREQLLREKRIEEKPFRLADLKGTSKVSLVNAMVDLEEITVNIKDIIFS